MACDPSTQEWATIADRFQHWREKVIIYNRNGWRTLELCYSISRWKIWSSGLDLGFTVCRAYECPVANRVEENLDRI